MTNQQEYGAQIIIRNSADEAAATNLPIVVPYGYQFLALTEQAFEEAQQRAAVQPHVASVSFKIEDVVAEKILDLFAADWTPNR